MRLAFNEVSSNQLKSLLLVMFFVVIIGALGTAIGFVYRSTYMGLILAVGAAMLYAVLVFLSGDRMILGMSGAKPVTKKDQPYLYNTIEGLAIAAGMPTPKAYVIDDSAINAFATGRDPKHASITVTSGLLKTMNRQELEGVIGHEMSHIKNYDVRLMMLTVVLVGVIVLLGDFLLRSFWYGRRKDDSKGSQLQAILLIATIILAILAPIIGKLIQLAISRRREFTADANSAVLTRYPPGLASALKKIAKDPDPLVDNANRAIAPLFISTPFRKSRSFVTNLFSTHPPIEERIKRLEEM